MPAREARAAQCGRQIAPARLQPDKLSSRNRATCRAPRPSWIICRSPTALAGAPLSFARVPLSLWLWLSLWLSLALSLALSLSLSRAAPSGKSVSRSVPLASTSPGRPSSRRRPATRGGGRSARNWCEGAARDVACRGEVKRPAPSCLPASCRFDFHFCPLARARATSANARRPAGPPPPPLMIDGAPGRVHLAHNNYTPADRRRLGHAERSAPITRGRPIGAPNEPGRRHAPAQMHNMPARR